ncbi:hypothetical protein E2C00_09255 [Streptomyces sp. WAC05374]|uniref:hypothetical protein n=1 Tax=Streptomyces sp. WAC05374 TaxID=2487420 RepID=UPI000F87866F|nr:hypothetical protein [Streptomyces sp. WAC05374]RST04776.1 hypothetical protein EF905_33490 [Streptomyces sp. WAC05374]TDF46994.1 hypothetical protein E2B92_08085 [Streptomyces sp. WAC05374]TDF57249.1 hypothetical protein E2C00_09255 [Streptomyces sp. WAC05374]TDF61352.1 hypothetical protein E2C02_00445 [Streptomyces sp. WAC05374]
MLDTTELTAAVERLADRLRAAPQSRLQRGAAADGLALARDLAFRAQRLENPRTPPRTMPDAGLFAVADQLVVACNDLAEILRTAPAGSPPRREALRRELDEAVAAVRRTAATATL